MIMHKHLRLTKTGAQDSRGLQLLRLALWDDGREVDRILVVSGQRSAQVFRRGPDSQTGSDEPLPEGDYRLGDPDAINGVNWASGVPGNFAGDWGEGLGPFWVAVHPGPGLRTSRAALGIHLDANAEYAPGTIGCVGIRSMTDLIRVASWFHDEDWPKTMVVDWGLGTVSKPEASPSTRVVKVFLNPAKPGAPRVMVDGKTVTDVPVEIRVLGSTLTLKLNNRLRAPVSLELVAGFTDPET